ncbi:MAG: type I methionyl aminopeptidase [Candidatus Sungiibacteriota bacterium]|uniref:Methionine aminopeptidase n=1 Tax=Candidatus Sungiibacteriota bacterium TaxID=2750080 RepID=A0A7T5RJ35_9BACT|nr:MAG: type I methionyl aminopeptidase [Candidatus Sungbacteria bacterium]
MITIKTSEEIKTLREGGRRLAEILQRVVANVKQGISTFELDRLAESLILASGGAPAFKGYRIKETRKSYPCSLCTSVNDEVVHAIPSQDRFLKAGDIIGLDIGMRWGGLFTDMAVTVGIGKISQEAERLIRITKESLGVGIRAVRPGARTGDVGYAVEQHLKKNKLGVIRDLAGHGVGYAVHEEPLIPNYGKPGIGPELKEGMVLAIEPMATLGDWRVVLADDEWTFKTMDGSLAAHFEHTVMVTSGGVEVLTKNSGPC